MRYAQGVITGAVLPLIIFFVAAVIKATGVGVVDPIAIQMLWDVYVIWFLTSIAIAIVPPILVFAVRREMFREFIIYEAGGFGFFSPIWLILFTDLAGESWITLFTEGITDGLIAPGIGGTIVGIDISNLFLIPFLTLSFILGIILLRPSFIQKYGVGEISELSALKKDTAPPTEPPTEKDPIEAEMPDVAPPEASEVTVADLRTLLTELGVPEPTINQILNSGIATTTDLVATSPDQLVTLTGLDKRTLEDIHMAVQKKVWFGGI